MPVARNTSQSLLSMEPWSPIASAASTPAARASATCAKRRVAHVLAQPLDRAAGRVVEALVHRVARRAHVAGRAHALLEQPQLRIEAHAG